MRFSNKRIGEFQKLWKEKTGQDISPEAAAEYAESITGLVESVVEWKQRKAKARDPP